MVGAKGHYTLSAKQTYLDNFFLSVFLSGAIVLTFLVLSLDKFGHWFVIPVFLCGVITCVDALRWIRNQISLLDPIGIIGLFGFWFFFVAPLLHVWFDYWMPFTAVIPPQDWREWVGMLAFFNFTGLIAFKLAMRTSVRNSNTRLSLWLIDGRIFWPVLITGLLLTAVLQIAAYYQFGGISGYITSYEETRFGSLAFRGWGIWFVFSESFPALLFIAYILLAQKNKILQGPFFILLALFSFLILKLVFGGLRGSRSELIFSLFWALGTVHLGLKPLSKRAVYLLLVFALIFMYLYGFYKGAGREVVSVLLGRVSPSYLEERTRRDELTVLLGDLSRTDIQSFLLYRIMKVRDYKYAWGRTYVGAISLLVPRSLWPDRPPTKVKEGTEAQYGMGSFVPDVFQSSKVYGLAGETMLNFTPLSIPIGFAFWGFLVARIRRFLASLSCGDPRLLIASWFVLAGSIVFLIGDSDNLVFFFVKNVALLYFVVWIGTKKKRLR